MGKSRKSLFTVNFVSESKSVKVAEGQTILDAAAKAGIKLYASCGGRGTCGKCRVNLMPDGEEVLACQYHVNGDLQVSVPASHRQVPHKILHHGVEYDVAISPAVKKVFIKPAENSASAVLDSLGLTNGSSDFSISESAAGSLGHFTCLDTAKGLTAVCLWRAKQQKEGWHVVSFEKGDTTNSLYGVAVDIGTTTVVAALVDLRTGDVKRSAAALNPQNAFGDDVISRITHGSDNAGLAQLHNVIVAKINELIGELCRAGGVDCRSVYELSVVGNTTMNHIFLALPIRQLGYAPYQAWSVDAHDIGPAELGIDINPAGNIHAVENIAGFVGADTVAAALAVRMDKATKMTLLIDIGTNGELVVGTKDSMSSASCAAGPAFEGARISCGSRAMEGAIERVAFDEKSQDIAIKTIGGKPAASLCGSGLIDAVGVLLELGVIDESGRMLTPDDAEQMPEKIRARMLEVDGQGAFILARDGQDVILTQRDIREVQLAKAAIRAGIKTLQAKAGVSDLDIQEYLVAGGFGNYIDAGHAMRIGLLPKVPLERVRFVGNAAASGAKLVLLNRDLRKVAGKLARQIRYVEIGNETEFQNVFAECLMF